MGEYADLEEALRACTRSLLGPREVRLQSGVETRMGPRFSQRGRGRSSTSGRCFCCCCFCVGAFKFSPNGVLQQDRTYRAHLAAVKTEDTSSRCRALLLLLLRHSQPRHSEPTGQLLRVHTVGLLNFCETTRLACVVLVLQSGSAFGW